MKNLKKLSIFLVIALITCGFTLPSYSNSKDELAKVVDGHDSLNSNIKIISVEKLTKEEKEEFKELDSWIGELQTQSRDIITPQGRSRPDEIWNVATQGRCSFSGEAGVSNLYSEYIFTGKTQYTYSITNWHDDELTIKVKKDNLLGSTIGTIKVPGNTKEVYTITTSDDFYIMYYAPIDASGYIE